MQTIKNNILGPAIAASVILSSSIAQAQEKVQGLICTVVESCDLDKSSLSTSYRPFEDNLLTDIPERLNINIQCVGDNGLRSTATQVLKWWEISKYGWENLIPYQLRHSSKEDSFLKRLSHNQDINCYFGDIEVPEKIED